MELTLIRHTKTDVPPGICYGQSNVGLADSFEDEYILLKEKIKGRKFDKVYSSPLKRCSILAGKLFPDKEIIYDNRLMELNFGDWEIKPWEDIENSPEGKAWFKNYLELPCPGGESYQDMKNQIGQILFEPLH